MPLSVMFAILVGVIAAAGLTVWVALQGGATIGSILLVSLVLSVIVALRGRRT